MLHGCVIRTSTRGGCERQGGKEAEAAGKEYCQEEEEEEVEE